MKKDTGTPNVGKAEDWDYLGEGNLNVICKYVGKDPALQGFVLRMKKNTHSEAFSGNYGIPEEEYRVLFDKALRGFPHVDSLLPQNVGRISRA